jgi:hypothetical protein
MRMQVEKVAAKKARTHTRYKLKDGTLVPGVTTCLGIMAKPALIKWANNLGLQGIDSTKYVDALAEIGTVAHEMVLCHHKKVDFDPTGHAPDIIDKAENALISYYNWEKNHDVEPILTEAALVSEVYGFGGTIDLVCKLDGELTLVDYKTSKGIFPEHIYQIAAYETLLKEHGYHIDGRRVLRIGRDESEGFDEKTIGDTDKEWEIFQCCLRLYQLGVTKR